MTPIDQFYKLARDADATQKSEDTRGFPDLEPFCLKIIDLTKTHPTFRADFVDAFKSVVNDASLGAWEIIMLCMHLLRWPEIRDWSEKRRSECIAANDWRGEPVFGAILAAFDDNWEDAEFYECLRNQA
jgi:hypothetical protein